MPSSTSVHRTGGVSDLLGRRCQPACGPSRFVILGAGIIILGSGGESLSRYQIAAKALNSKELDLFPLFTRDVTRLHPRVRFGNDDVLGLTRPPSYANGRRRCSS